MKDEEATALLDRAEDLRDAGRPGEALELLEALDDDDIDRWLVTASIYTEYGDWPRAAAAIDRARGLGDDSKPYVDCYEGRLRLRQWRLDEARALLADVPEEAGGGARHADLAVLADLAEDYDAADAHLTQAASYHPEPVPPPLRLEPAAFREIVHEAAQDLPDEFRAAFETVAVVIDPMPTAAILDAPASGHPPDVLGLFVGLPLHEKEARGHGELPATIFLFQRNIERVAHDHATLREEVRITLYHELGHALGFDEAGVDDLGLG